MARPDTRQAAAESADMAEQKVRQPRKKKKVAAKAAGAMPHPSGHEPGGMGVMPPQMMGSMGGRF